MKHQTYFTPATEQRLAEEAQADAERYERYIAWCGISGVKPRTLDVWQSRHMTNKIRGMCLFCVTGRHLCCANAACTCRPNHSSEQWTSMPHVSRKAQHQAQLAGGAAAH